MSTGGGPNNPFLNQNITSGSNNVSIGYEAMQTGIQIGTGPDYEKQLQEISKQQEALQKERSKPLTDEEKDCRAVEIFEPANLQNVWRHAIPHAFQRECAGSNVRLDLYADKEDLDSLVGTNHFVWDLPSLQHTFVSDISNVVTQLALGGGERVEDVVAMYKAYEVRKLSVSDLIPLVREWLDEEDPLLVRDLFEPETHTGIDSSFIGGHLGDPAGNTWTTTMTAPVTTSTLDVTSHQNGPYSISSTSSDITRKSTMVTEMQTLCTEVPDEPEEG